MRLRLCGKQQRGFLLSLLLLGGVCGCHAPLMPAPPVSMPVSTVRSTTSAFSPSRVQSLPLYRQAEQACKQKQLARAADLLGRLAASPGLSAEEVAFVQQQRALCLKSASPSLAPVSVSVPPAPSDADCGPRALLLVCQKLGVSATVEKLRQWAGTDGKGTSMAGLAKAAEAVGLKTEGVQVSREALSEVELPAIAWVNQNHYVALLSIQGEGENATATIHDPNHDKEETIEKERLLRRCGGYLLLIHR